jgi:hypothetical protein
MHVDPSPRRDQQMMGTDAIDVLSLTGAELQGPLQFFHISHISDATSSALLTVSSRLIGDVAVWILPTARFSAPGQGCGRW